MRKVFVLFLLLNINLLAAHDCGVNIYNVATGKLHKKFLNGNQVHPKNKNIVSKRCTTDVEKNVDDINSFNVVAICEFEDGDKIFDRSTNDYEKASGSGGIMATYSYNMFGYEIICAK